MTKSNFIFQLFTLSYFTQHGSRNGTIPAKAKTFRQLRLLSNTTTNTYLIEPFNFQLNEKKINIHSKRILTGSLHCFNCQNNNGQILKLKYKTVFYKGLWQHTKKNFI